MRIRHALWLCAVLGCSPGPTIHLGSWPADAAQADAGGVDGGEPDEGEGGEDGDEHSTDDQEPEDLVPCSMQSECADLERRSHCQVELGHCVECLVDSDCEPGKYCASNVCQDE
jgi:hypothetical protein